MANVIQIRVTVNPEDIEESTFVFYEVLPSGHRQVVPNELTEFTGVLAADIAASIEATFPDLT